MGEGLAVLDAEALRGFLEAYINGDVTAKKVLLDFLDDEGDPRAEAVRAEAIDWDAVAVALSDPRYNHHPPDPFRPSYRPPPEANYDRRIRWLIDCARVGDSVPPVIARAVSEARRDWLKELFPEAGL